MDAANSVKAGAQLIDMGLPGIAIFGLSGAVIFLMLKLLQSWSDRFKDANKQTEILQSTKEALGTYQRSMDEAARSRLDIAQFMQEQTRAIASLEKAIEVAVVRTTERHGDMRDFISDQIKSVKNLFGERWGKLTDRSGE